MSVQSGFWHAFQQFFQSLFRRFEALGAQIHSRRGRYLVVGLPLLWFSIFFAAPLFIVLKISLAQQEIAQPPYRPLIEHPEPHITVLTVNTGNYHLLWNDLRQWFREQKRALVARDSGTAASGDKAGTEADAPTSSLGGDAAAAMEPAAPVDAGFVGADAGFALPDDSASGFNANQAADQDTSAPDTASESGFDQGTGFASPEPVDDVGTVDAGFASVDASDAGFALNVGSAAGDDALVLDAEDVYSSEAIYAPAFANSLRLALVSTLLALLVGYPMAYVIAKSAPRWRVALLLLVVLPFWTSSLLRTYAWLGLLKDTGPLNGMLLGLGLIDQPLRILDTEWAIYIGMVYNYLPFMVLPLVANLVKLDPVLLEAASDLGARPWRAFVSITLPLSMPGILAGCMLVFIPCIGEFVIPDLLGGGRVQTIGMTLWNEFFKNTDWPLASSIAIAMLMLIVLPLIVFEYVQSTRLNPANAGGRR